MHPRALSPAATIRFISSREDGHAGVWVTFGGFTRSAGLSLMIDGRVGTLSLPEASLARVDLQIRFGAFTFDAGTGSLNRNGAPVPLQSQPARVLALLTARPGVIVTRDELRREVWRDTWVDFDQGLNFCIRQIRIALEDEARRPTFVQTLPNRGYRFVAAVTPLAAPTSGLPTERRRSLRARVTRAAALTAAAIIIGIAIGLQSARVVVAELGPASDLQHLRAHLEPGDFVRGAWRHHLKPFFSSTPVSVGAPASDSQSQPATPASPPPGS